MAKKTKKSKAKKKAKVVTPEVVTSMPVPKSDGSLTHSDPLTQYLTQIRGFPVLDRSETQSLAPSSLTSSKRATLALCMR